MATVKTRQQLEAAFAPGTFQTSSDYADVFASFVHQSDEVHSTSEDILFVDLSDDDTAQASPRLQPWVELGAKKIG